MFQSAYSLHGDPATEMEGEQAGPLPPGTAGHQPGLLWGQTPEGFHFQTVGHIYAGFATGIIG